MPQFQLDRLNAWVTKGGLWLRVDDGIGYTNSLDLSTSETMMVLRLLYTNRAMLYPGYASGVLCPACATICQLEMTPGGYYGSCRQCGNDFELDVTGVLVRNHYGQYVRGH